MQLPKAAEGADFYTGVLSAAAAHLQGRVLIHTLRSQALQGILTSQCPWDKYELLPVLAIKANVSLVPSQAKGIVFEAISHCHYAETFLSFISCWTRWKFINIEGIGSAAMLSFRAQHMSAS